MLCYKLTWQVKMSKSTRKNNENIKSKSAIARKCLPMNIRYDIIKLLLLML